MADEMRITLEIIPGGNKYRLTVDADEEELVRKAAEQLRRFFRLYRDTFPNENASTEDIMAMIALDIATRYLRLEIANDTVKYTAKIQQLDNELKTYLQEQ